MSIPTWVLDASALAALFEGHEELHAMLQAADQGKAKLLLPAVAVAEAESHVRAGYDGWSLLSFSSGVKVLHLDQSTAIELGHMPGPPDARHAMHAARAVNGVVVTRAPGDYAGMPGALKIV